MKYILIGLLLLMSAPHTSEAVFNLSGQATKNISSTDRLAEIDAEINKLKSQIEELEKERENLLGSKKTKKREVITLKENFEGSFDLAKPVKLASFEIFSKEKALDGTTFKAHVKGLVYPETPTYSCPDLIRKGKPATCTIKIQTNRANISYTITDISIQVSGGSTIYKNKFPAVTGTIADQ